MNAQELYEEIKASLKFFELSFSEMGKVRVTFIEGAVQLHYGGRTIIVTESPDE